jgi:hypothetical protein
MAAILPPVRKSSRTRSPVKSKVCYNLDQLFLIYKLLYKPEEWPLLGVETEVNGVQRVQMKGVLPWLVRWACRAGTREFCSALPALV